VQHTYYFAQAYGEGNYGTGTYSCTTQQQQNGQCTTAGSGSNGSNGGPLANTGLVIALIVTIACLIVFVSLLVRIWRRPRTATVPVEAAQPTDTTAAPQQ
jgi:hypothetical protein